MTRNVQQLLDTFDGLPEPEQREVASEILRRFGRVAVDSISNDELILSAENLFLEIDQLEGNQ